jgi:hypothetical protein
MWFLIQRYGEYGSSLVVCVDGTDDDSRKSGSYAVIFVSRYPLVKQLVIDFCWYEQETIIQE